MIANKKLNKELLLENLEHNILDFWISRMQDPVNGGFYGRIDGKDQLHEKADKGVILNSRILWTFSAAYQCCPRQEYLDVAKNAYNYLSSHFFDDELGGVYWMLDYKGNPVERKKQVYAQSFCIYGLSEYYKITQDEKAKSLAIGLFELMEQHAFDSEKNGYFEALDREWQPLPDVRLSEKDMNAQKTMNTHLHILEAYTNLYRIWKSEKLEEQLKNLIELMSEKFVSDHYHFHLFFDDDWLLLSEEVSYGHDIEGSWLLHEAAEELGAEELLRNVEKIALKMVDAALEGMDEDGGLMNEGDEKGVIDDDKHWWPQAEALVGLINAHHLSGDEKYYTQAERTWGFIENNLIDHQSGEWHWKISKDGQNDFKEDKAGPWKCPYHNGRALLELLNRLYSN